MPNIKALRPVVHEKKLIKEFCYTNQKKLFPLRAWSFATARTLFEQVLISWSKAYSIPNRPVVHEKKIFKGFCHINYIKLCPLRAWPFMTPRTLFEPI